MKIIQISLIFFFITNSAIYSQNRSQVLYPHIKGDWWQIAGNPDIGEYTSEKQQPVDFGIWQASDGTWQLWSCIRHTHCGGQTRLFYRWQSQSLTNCNWTPVGIAMEADTTIGETFGGLQAPFVLKDNDIFWMFYGDWGRICLAKSSDGKSFKRVLNKNKNPALFSGPYTNTRDPMVITIGELYYCYYMGHNEEKKPHSAIFCRTSTDLFHWSEPVMVSAGGIAATKTDWYGGDAECPFVFFYDSLYYLFRNQRYGENNLNTQYCSPNPLDFGVNDDRYLISTLEVAAPEIILHDNQYYIAALLPSLKGIRLAKLEWIKKQR